MKRILRFIFLHLLLLEIMTGSSTPAYLFETIDITHGLSLNSVKTIAKDKYGFMWFGTEDGLNRYDGISFKTFRIHIHAPIDARKVTKLYVGLLFFLMEEERMLRFLFLQKAIKLRKNPKKKKT